MKGRSLRGDATREAIRSASLALIFEKGFEAMSLRMLAAKVGLGVGSLYNHFRTKDDLLVYIVKATHDERQARMRMSLKHTSGPFEAFCAFIRTAVVLQTQYQQETVISDRDMHHLPQQALKEVLAARDRYDHMLTEIIVDGVAKGVFSVNDPRIATFAILGMINRISVWYRPKGRLSQAELQDMFLDYSLKIMGAKQKEEYESVRSAKNRRAVARL